MPSIAETRVSGYSLCRIESKARTSSQPLLTCYVMFAKRRYRHGDRPRLVDINLSITL